MHLLLRTGCITQHAGSMIQPVQGAAALPGRECSQGATQQAGGTPMLFAIGFIFLFTAGRQHTGVSPAPPAHL